MGPEKRLRRDSPSAEDREYFASLIDQQRVDDITIDFFYKPHSVSLLLFILGILFSFPLIRESQGWQMDLYYGAMLSSVIFIMISVLIMPNGPFTRPHPALWRMVFGACLLYFMAMVCTSFMHLQDARRILIWLDPKLTNMTHGDILSKEYAVNCSQVSWQRIYSHMDEFALAHFLGWIVKTILLRHYLLTWFMSISWEITEVMFCHAMPNFCECWWDSIGLDILLCNGLGITCGWVVCRWLEMRNYHWEGIRAIQGTSGKLKRAVLQFTPRSWYPTRWLDNDSTIQRLITISLLFLVFQVAELNCFLLKHIFIVKPSHPFTLARLALITLSSAPGIRQYYLYVTDPYVNRIGSQLWLFVAIIGVELVVVIKFGSEILEKTMMAYLMGWVFILIGGSFLLLMLCLMIAHRYQHQRAANIANNSGASPLHNNHKDKVKSQ